MFPLCNADRDTACSPKQDPLQDEFRTMVERNRQRLVRVAARYSNSWEQAEDAVQSALVKAWLALATFRKDAKLSTWVTRIVINEVFQMNRKYPADRFVALTESNQDTLCFKLSCCTVPSPETLLLKQERAAHLTSMLRGLPPKFRKALQSHHLEERSIEETARRLDITTASAKTHALRGRLELQRRLKRIHL